MGSDAQGSDTITSLGEGSARRYVSLRKKCKYFGVLELDLGPLALDLDPWELFTCVLVVGFYLFIYYLYFICVLFIYVVGPTA